MSDKTTISIERDQKDLVDETQAAIAAELGFEPNQGQTVIYACRRLLEESDGESPPASAPAP